MDSVLLVADWDADPREVIAAAQRRAGRGACEFDLLVPAWLHGLAWAGDPHANVAAARDRLSELSRLLAEADAGVRVRSAAVGDPDPVTAILDALAEHCASDLIVCVHGAGRSPLDLARRARRFARLPVERVRVARAPRSCDTSEVRPQHPRALSAATPV